jgi:DNA-binding transcriptional ArsR family regulator
MLQRGVSESQVSNAADDIGGTAWPDSSTSRSPWTGAKGHILQWLETFRVVASSGHFTAAAVELGYSQATVTVHIKALERVLGVTLFERCRFSKNIVLTEAGCSVLEKTAPLLALADEMTMAVRRFSTKATEPAAANKPLSANQ